MQMVEINSKNVDSITREGKTYLYFTAGFSPFAAAMEPVYQKFLMEAEQYDVKVCRINVTDDIALGSAPCEGPAHYAGVPRWNAGAHHRGYCAARALHQFTEVLLRRKKACRLAGFLITRKMGTVGRRARRSGEGCPSGSARQKRRGARRGARIERL
ncbi:MAG: hypothetical protein ACLTY5_02795 [Angelakisella sp.]